MTQSAHQLHVENPIVVGKIGAAYGVRGWLKIISATEAADAIIDYQPWMLKVDGNWQQIVVESWRHQQQHIIAKLVDIDDRNSAARLTNQEIFINAKQLPTLAEGDYYWKDLIACSVVTRDGYNLGRVVTLMETGSNDVLVVKANLNDAYGAKERLIPFLDGSVIKQVDLEACRICVDWDPGF